jgi:hypothetical protein
LLFSQPSIAPISGFCAAPMRSANRLTCVDLARSGARAVISSAWLWCVIIICA